MRTLSKNPLDAIVTEAFRAKTHCHDNFGYCARKLLIPLQSFRENVGLWCALIPCASIIDKVKLVYT